MLGMTRFHGVIAVVASKADRRGQPVARLFGFHGVIAVAASKVGIAGAVFDLVARVSMA